MKTITVTTQNAINYGAVLQAYALHRKLTEWGADDRLLNLKRQSRVCFQRLALNRDLPFILYHNLRSLPSFPAVSRRVRRFRAFVRDEIPMTREYENARAVADDPPKADVYITGGDQMFNAFQGVQPAAMLRFGAADTKRISYSTSMGQAAVADAYVEEYTAALRAYDALSLREEGLRAYIEGLAGFPCRTDLDPSFLLTREEWSALAVPPTVRRPYALCYVLLEHPLLQKAADRLRAETGLPLVVLNGGSRPLLRGDWVVNDAGPREFLGWFMGAKAVLTTSFHGTCFSILLEKDFWTLARARGETRIHALAKKMGLESRIVTEKLSSITPVDFAAARAVIAAGRGEAEKYLKRELGL